MEGKNERRGETKDHRQKGRDRGGRKREKIEGRNVGERQREREAEQRQRRDKKGT